LRRRHHNPGPNRKALFRRARPSQSLQLRRFFVCQFDSFGYRSHLGSSFSFSPCIASPRSIISNLFDERNTSDLQVLEVIAPTFKEQQKIANCLASLDELIAAQTQKLEILKVHKKGLMQQLFPIMEETQQ
jgi:hypothetical protein